MLSAARIGKGLDTVGWRAGRHAGGYGFGDVAPPEDVFPPADVFPPESDDGGGALGADGGTRVVAGCEPAAQGTPVEIFMTSDVPCVATPEPPWSSTTWPSPAPASVRTCRTRS